jgi:hypothetical protein
MHRSPCDYGRQSEPDAPTDLQNFPRVFPQGLAPYLAVMMTVVTLLVVWAGLCAI